MHDLRRDTAGPCTWSTLLLFRSQRLGPFRQGWVSWIDPRTSSPSRIPAESITAARDSGIVLAPQRTVRPAADVLRLSLRPIERSRETEIQGMLRSGGETFRGRKIGEFAIVQRRWPD